MVKRFEKEILNFNKTIDTWIQIIEPYTFQEIMTKPSENSWSLGQVSIHLIQSTGYFLKQIRTSLSNNENMDMEMSNAARSMFRNNSFPNMLLEGPPSNKETAGPQSKEEILSGLKALKTNLEDMGHLLQNSPYQGKTPHSSLGYFSAQECLIFSEMHLRHHFRQYERIKNFLNQE